MFFLNESSVYFADTQKRRIKMSRIFGKIKVLTDSEMSRIHETTLAILADVGMKIHLKEARDILGSYGCTVDEDRKIVRFPAGLVDTTVKRMRKDFLRSERVGLKQAVRYGEVGYYKRSKGLHHNFTCNAGGFCTLIYDLAGQRRQATMADLHDSFKLINSLDDITYSGLPVSDQDTPHQLRPIKMAAELAKYSTKIGGIEAWTIDNIRYIEEIATVVRGSRENLRKGHASSGTPRAAVRFLSMRTWRHCSSNTSAVDSRNLSTPCPASATGAGTLTLGLAETLAGLVLGYAVDENAVMGIDFTGGYADMKSLLFSVGGPDRQALMGSWAQMMTSYYGITAVIHGGKTNACEPGF
jgi:trimethylamine--corrinoid protein Co-methyltransferase